MNKLIKINNYDLEVKELNGERVVTFKDIDILHERPDGTAGRNFRENKFSRDGNERFIKGSDYYILSGSELQEYKQSTNFVGSNAKEIILITESGYLMLVKSFNDDLAWKVQRQLVNSYFRTKKLSAIDQLRLQYEVLTEHDERLKMISSKVESLENTMTIDYSQQLVLQQLGKARVINLIGGLDSLAYKDVHLRTKVFSSIWKDLKDYLQVNSYKNTAIKDYQKAKEFLSNWNPQGKLLREIESLNLENALVKDVC